MKNQKIEHPTMSIKTLEAKAKPVSKRSRTNGATARVVAILKTAKQNGQALTQAQIRDCTLTSKHPLREQHINNIVRKLESQGKIKRHEMLVTSSDKNPTALIYNEWIG